MKPMQQIAGPSPNTHCNTSRSEYITKVTSSQANPSFVPHASRNLRHPAALSLPMTAAGGRRGDLEALNGSTASAVARLVQPDKAGLEHLTRCLVFPTRRGHQCVLLGCPVQVSSVGLSRGQVQGSGLGVLAKPRQADSHKDMIASLVHVHSRYLPTRRHSTACHHGTKEPPTTSISLVARPCTKM